MNYSVIALPKFRKDLKQLAKKYPSLKLEISKLFYSLEINPIQGVLIANNCYKIRLAIASKAKGKSSGARVITHIVVTEKCVYLLTIYDKSYKESLTDKELKDLFKEIYWMPYSARVKCL